MGMDTHDYGEAGPPDKPLQVSTLGVSADTSGRASGGTPELPHLNRGPNCAVQGQPIVPIDGRDRSGNPAGRPHLGDLVSAAGTPEHGCQRYSGDQAWSRSVRA